MPALALLLEGIFKVISAWLLKLFAARVAIRVAAVAAIAGFGTVLLTTFNGVIAPLASAAFSTSLGQFLGLAFPPIAGTCIGAMITVWVACTTYKLQTQAIKVTAGI